MKIKYLTFLFALLLVSASVAAERITAESTANDRVSLKITVYNNNLGLIEDTRKVKLPPGTGWIRFMDIAPHIIPASVYAKSSNYPDQFTLHEQHYEYDLINEDKLLDKYVGKEIKIVNFNEFQDRKETVAAILLSNNKGQIYKINDEIYLGHPGYKILPELPESITAKPTLTWLYTNKGSQAHNLKVSYLTNNINWKADYVVIVNKKDTLLDISAWATLDNKSGATYKDADLKLVAGRVNRVEQKPPTGMMMFREVKTSQFEEKKFAEYHIYDLNRKTTIKDKQIKQVSLFEAAGVEIHKELITRGLRRHFIQRFRERSLKQPVAVYLKFKNSKGNNLGMPFPSGVMRVYKKYDDESLQFIGENKIMHTPKNEEIKLKIGEVFDVAVERVQTDYHKISTRAHTSGWEVTVKNHEKEDIAIGVEEQLLFDNWEITSNSHPYEKIDAFTVRFNVKVPEGEQITIKYRVKIGL